MHFWRPMTIIIQLPFFFFLSGIAQTLLVYDILNENILILK